MWSYEKGAGCPAPVPLQHYGVSSGRTYAMTISATPAVGVPLITATICVSTSMTEPAPAAIASAVKPAVVNPVASAATRLAGEPAEPAVPAGVPPENTVLVHMLPRRTFAPAGSQPMV